MQTFSICRFLLLSHQINRVNMDDLIVTQFDLIVSLCPQLQERINIKSSAIFQIIGSNHINAIYYSNHRMT